ncbi:hypothetical protein C6P40_001622 [Pichia californica]|uniref:WD40 repeat-like protein n=1 Tax=Pichia californica TaxID=460514 RepID=A0A9P7BIK9_9ASCO|nr:hypothetical protein C6P40_001622 [[Candida] californica]
MSFFKSTFSLNASGNLTNSSTSSVNNTKSSNTNLSSQPAKKKSLTYILNTSNENHMKGHHSIGVNSLLYNKTDKSLISGGRDGQISIWKFDSNEMNNNNDNDNNDNSDTYDNLKSNTEIRNHIFQNLDNDNELSTLQSSIQNGISSVSIPKSTSSPYYYNNSYLHHFGWINDMCLLNDNETIVSCSNDLSIKLWNYNNGTKSTLGYHDDYIKKIGYTKSFSNQLVSAGLDKIVKIWDITKGETISSYKFKDFNNSIYSLDVNNNFIICSGPSNIVNLFDRRDMSRPAKSFLGHTDNVRSLILKDNSFLSGSSDTSIKLWDLRTTRIIRNFEMHNSPVWSLNSPDYLNDFSIFYSADKSGLLLKTDLRASDLSSSNVGGYFNYKVNESLGISTVVANINYSNTTSENSSISDFTSTLSGINDIIETDELGTVWTATASSIHNSNTNFISSWSIPQTSKLVIHQGLIFNKKLASLYNNGGADPAVVTPSSTSTATFQQSFQIKKNPSEQTEIIKSNDSINDTEDLVSQLSSDDLEHIDNAIFSNSNGLDKILVGNSGLSDSPVINNDLVNMTNELNLKETKTENEHANVYDDDDDDVDDDYDYATCFVELMGNVNIQYLFTNDYFNNLESDVESLDPFKSDNNVIDNPFLNQENNLKISRKMEINYQYINDEDVLLLPYNIKPISKISGSSGLIKCKILNNRRHVAAMDQSGCVYIFDILKCKLIQRVDNHLSINSIESVEKKINSSNNTTVSDLLNDVNEDELNMSDRFDAVCEKFQTQETLPTWCSVQVKSGQLFITLKENNFIACEIYTDDFFDYYHDLNNQSSVIKNLRVDLGKIVVKSFFGNILETIFFKHVKNYSSYKQISSESKSKEKNNSITAVNEHNSNVPISPVPIPKPNVHSRPSTPTLSASSGDKGKRGLFGRLKTKDSKKESTPPPSNVANSRNGNSAVSGVKSKVDLIIERINHIDDTPQLLKFIESNPESVGLVKSYEEGVDDRNDDEIPIFNYILDDNIEKDMSTLVVINEETPQLETRPAYTIYLHELVQQMVDDVEIKKIIDNIPIWIAKGLILNMYPIPSSMSMKIGFTLSPAKGSGLKKLNDESEMKLNAVGTLRVSRIIEFIKGKLSEDQSNLPIELICKDTILGEKYTIGTIKARIWKQGGDITLFYQVRK